MDHIGDELNEHFQGMTSQPQYEAFDSCLKRLEDIFQRGTFYNMFVSLRNKIKKRHALVPLVEGATVFLIKE